MRSSGPVPGARPGWARSAWFRAAGYGGAALLAVAAVVVLLMPLMDGGKRGTTTGASTPAVPSGGRSVVPGGTVPVTPTGSAPSRDRGGEPYPGGRAGGPPLPDQGRSAALAPCPRGSAYYRAVPGGVDVVVGVSAGGAIRAELFLRGGGTPESRQATVRGRGSHTFHFRGAAPRLVQRVKVTAISVGVAMRTCYARAVA
ncbi:hypothetical protein BZB76_6755 [Actinomadura pelletieri DSM 43383]|uniref:Uncharacterized protein n=1 Tax=Actinomadura pelletieri DSM 43383 TaxID=1120940 RepID=A0A495Q913_9ACTN|nr:hypothetical protein [Actinomadura pelletieri]RKS67803.1 hypothetical protein BZB76_6755 [Actinomadura pelletieri DSM 43383]